ncbi:hypothetical protein BC834DRAFT_846880 [Gloeopeniophorella convolvens]|nr:hypothetical protein BC834DRAFT_846880 [Gloeopeniophorella convolvens]
MVNWQDPARVAADYLAFIKLIHVMAGILIWDFVVNLPFDMSVFTKKRKLRWTFMLYLGCRWWPILCITVILVGMDVGHKINCVLQRLVKEFISQRPAQTFAYLSFIFASALIVLRIWRRAKFSTAIWDRNKFAVGLASAAWLASTGSYLQSVHPSFQYTRRD